MYAKLAIKTMWKMKYFYIFNEKANKHSNLAISILFFEVFNQMIDIIIFQIEN